MQTSGYTTNQDLGIAGQIADSNKSDLISLQNSESAGVPFGIGVVDKGDGTFEDPDALTKKIRGVLVHSHAFDNDALDPAGVPTKQLADVMVRGRIVVVPEDAVTAGAEAYVRYAGTGTKGAFRAVPVAAEHMHLNNARFRTAADAGKPAVLELQDGVGEPDIATITVPMPVFSATTTLELGAVPKGRHVRVRSATLSGGAAGNSPDNYTFDVKSGSTVLASYNTDAGAQGTIVQNTPKAMVPAAAAGASLERLTFVATKGGSAANTTAGEIMVELELY